MLQEQWTTNWGNLGPSSGWICMKKQPKLLMLRCWSLPVWLWHPSRLCPATHTQTPTHTDTHTHRHAHTPTHPNLQKLHCFLPIRGVFPQLGEHISVPCIKQGWRGVGVGWFKSSECSATGRVYFCCRGVGVGWFKSSECSAIGRVYFCCPASKLTRWGGGGGGVKSGEGLATGWVYFCCSASKWTGSRGQQFTKNTHCILQSNVQLKPLSLLSFCICSEKNTHLSETA